jgi:DNA-binding transcriptional regulator YiaG
MPVSPTNSFEYQFSPSALNKVRSQLGLSQAKLAGRLELPVNTVSRWERGETTPDAHSLAAIYSIAKEQGLTARFFSEEVKHGANSSSDD